MEVRRSPALPKQSPNYKMSDHWWGMLIDIPKCIGCGNCVRACQTENDVPDGYFRTWVERYHVSDEDMTKPEVISPDGGKEGFPVAAEDEQEILLRSQDVQPLRRFALHAGLPGGRHLRQLLTAWCWWTRSIAWAAPIACRPALTAAATSIRRKKVADKCTLCYHRITKGLTTACCEACPTGARQLVDLKNPKDPIHEFLKTHSVQVLKPQMATGAKAFYNGLDGSVR